jgi:hypothetical protein
MAPQPPNLAKITLKTGPWHPSVSGAYLLVITEHLANAQFGVACAFIGDMQLLIAAPKT